MDISLRSVLFLLLMFASLCWHVACGAGVDVIVDDQGPDPTTGESINYEGSWNLQPGCTVCTATPQGAHDGTWHDTSFDVTSPSQLPTNATFSFTGTAIYVFGMVDNYNGIELVFYLDGEPPTYYTSPPSTEQAYNLNQTYFQAQGLTNTQHLLKLQNGRLDTMHKSVVLFDYLVYTRDDSDSASSAAPSLGSVASSSSPMSFTARSSAPSSASYSTVIVPPESSAEPSTGPPKTLSTEPSSAPSTPTSTMASSAPSTVLSTNPSTTSSTTPSTTSALSTGGSHVGLSGTTRTVVISVTIIAGIAILGNLGLLYRARRNRLQRGTGSADAAPSSVHSAATGSNGGLGILRHVDHVTPQASHYSLAPDPFINSNTDQSLIRLTDKARDAVASARSSPTGHREQRPTGERASSSVDDVVFDILSVHGQGGSIAAETAPPMYEREVGNRDARLFL